MVVLTVDVDDEDDQEYVVILQADVLDQHVLNVMLWMMIRMYSHQLQFALQ